MIKTRLTDEQLGRLRAFRGEHGPSGLDSVVF
jgi:hypothetical protein